MIRPGPTARRFLLWTALPLAFPGCRAKSPDRPAGNDSTATVAINPSTPQGQIALELWQLRAGTTLGDWKGLHPDETILGSDSSPLARHFLGPWCAFSTHRAAAGSLTIVRSAYFYAPPPPPSLAVPDTGALDLARQCVIGLMWVDAEVGDSLAAASLADSVHRQLGTLYGTEVPRPVQFFGSAYWSRTHWFSKDSLAAVMALRAPGTATGNGTRVVTAFAYLPISGVSAGGDVEPHEAWSPVDTFPLDSALGLAQLDTALSSPLLAALKDEGSTAPRSAAAGDSLVRPLVRWLRAAAPLAPPRKAAALYVADQVLARAMCGHRLCEKEDDAALAPLKALGAQFSWGELGGTIIYHHTLLTQARALARDTPLGDRILIAQLLSGFDFSGACTGGAEGFRRVIENGERYLTRLPESPIAPDVHYLVGDAWRDVVALAHGAAGEYGDSSRYKAEAPDAARKALAHYVAAMRAGAGHPAARAAWSRAWWLRAGLVPRDVRFYCVYD
ncbi:MAG: hypothetical protein ACHQU1_02875 [Gemmatimonadales bacterium]